MRTALRALTALFATVTLLATVGAANARQLSVSNTAFRIVWTPLSLVEPGGISITCNETMEGSFHTSTIAKVERSLVGWITRANVAQATCRESVFGTGAAVIPHNGSEVALGRTVEQSLPWHLTYEGFRGTLPNITGITLLLRGVIFSLSIPITGCLAVYGRPETNLRLIANLTAGTATTLTPEGNPAVPLAIVLRGRCPPSVRLSGNGTITLLGSSTTRITVTLI